MPLKYAILLDGGFVTWNLKTALGRFPAAKDIQDCCISIMESDHFKDMVLLRTFFYDAPPATETLENPIDGSTLKLSSTTIYREHDKLIKQLGFHDNFALRLGDTKLRGGKFGSKAWGWKVGSSALEAIAQGKHKLEPRDLVPDIVQKGVDLRIGLDISRLALKEMVHAIVVVTGDSDFVPAFKFARREGVRVYLDCMNEGVSEELKVHADIVLNILLK